MPEPLRITVRFFSHVKHAVGADSKIIEVPPGSSTALIEQRVRDLAPRLLAEMRWRVALNREFVQSETPLADGDEVALIPPVQGG